VPLINALTTCKGGLELLKLSLSPEGLASLEVPFDERELVERRITKSLRYGFRRKVEAPGRT
jgi:hypothetical protein